MAETLDKPRIGLVLSGGGARAAYQVGALHAIANLLPRGASNPFPIICGTSAGAINAAALASNAANFRRGVRRLVSIWRNFQVSQVYRSDVVGVAKSGARWLAAMVFGGLGKTNPVSLLDNSPLAALLRDQVDFAAVEEAVAAGDLLALSVTAMGYTTGQSVTFYQGTEAFAPWQRARRIGIRTKIDLPHLMASSAIPFVFPAVRINREYFGDGSMRQLAPISPALHLGADRVLVIAVGRMSTQGPARIKTTDSPSLAQIAGHALSSIFLDTLEVDIERLERVNRTLAAIPPEILLSGKIPLRKVDYLVISPSEEIEPIAQRHGHRLPRSIRFFLRGIGATRRSGANLLSYLLFERAYCRALIAMGYADVMRRRDEVIAFLSPGPR